MSLLTDKELLEELQKRFEDNQLTIEELQKRTQELKEVNKKLEESEALKSHFISNITNEIINPFTSILGLSKNILLVKKEEWKKVISMVALIHSEAFNLDFQLRNIFVAAKIEAGEVYPEVLKVNMEALIKSAADSFKIEAKKKNIEIILEVMPSEGADFSFKTDSEKVKLILANLLSNAVKYTSENGKIIIRLSFEGELIKIEVIDNGAGISEENQKIIFDRFKRLDSGINSINRGHGLGLSINKALIDLLGGSIQIKSQLEKGAAFTILLPESQSDIAGFSNDGNDFLFDEDETF